MNTTFQGSSGSSDNLFEATLLQHQLPSERMKAVNVPYAFIARHARRAAYSTSDLKGDLFAYLVIRTLCAPPF
jgi:hypothetical protein